MDKICKTILSQAEEDKSKIGLTVADVLDTLKLIIGSELRVAGVTLEESFSVEKDAYIYGKIDDVIFILSEIINRLASISNRGDKILLNIRENEDAWYISISQDKNYLIDKTKVYLIKNIIARIEDVGFEEVAGQYVVEIKKK